MSSKVEIVNLALSKLGQRPISSLEENTVAARSAALVYDSVRRQVLQSFSWAFAVRSEKLQLKASVPVDYRYAFQLPVDFLRAITMNTPVQTNVGGVPEESRKQYVIRGRELLANAPVVVLEYVADITDESLFDSKFTEAFVLKLASELAVPVGGKTDLLNAYNQQYEYQVRHSAAQSEKQFYEEQCSNPYLAARFY